MRTIDLQPTSFQPVVLQLDFLEPLLGKRRRSLPPSKPDSAGACQRAAWLETAEIAKIVAAIAGGVEGRGQILYTFDQLAELSISAGAYLHCLPLQSRFRALRPGQQLTPAVRSALGKRLTGLFDNNEVRLADGRRLRLQMVGQHRHKKFVAEIV